MITGFKNKHLLSIVAVFLLVVLVAVPVMGAERATKENMCEPFDFDESNPKEIPTSEGREIYVPSEWELGYNPAEQDGPAPTQGDSKTGTVAVVVNGNPVYFPDQQPYIDKAGRTVIPVRFVSEALGAEVDADKDSIVTIKRGDVVIKHKIGTNAMTVNGVSKTFDTKSVLTKQYRTMVPLRFISEALGAKVGWNADTWTATVDL
jgi:hypothetical protein